MSLSRLPRIYLDGHFSWNPSTFNNDDYAGGGLRPWDQFESLPNWDWLRTQTYRGQPVTKANFREWAYDDLFELETDSKPDPAKRLPPSEWNLFGGMECGFVTESFPALAQPDNPDDPGHDVFSKPGGTAITGFTDAGGTYRDDDAVVGAELQFNLGPHRGPFPASPKLIDIDPTSPFTSQVFADDLRVGDGTLGFEGRVSQRMHSRWMNLAHNMNQDAGLMIAGVAAAVMRTGLRHDEIEWGDPTPALEELRAASADAAGVLFQMTVFDTRYFNGPFFGDYGKDQFKGMVKIRELYRQYFRQLDEFDNGLRTHPPAVPCNRAFSRLVGWIGVWEHDDLVTVPSGRLLLSTVLPDQPAVTPKPAPVQPRNAHAGSSVPFGPAVVDRNPDFSRVTIDLGAAVPELDSTGAFVDAGSLELGISIDGEFHRLTTVLDDTAGFAPIHRRTAGVIDLPVDGFDDVGGAPITAERFDRHPLVLRASSWTSSDGPPPEWQAKRVDALVENPLVAETNTRGLYVDADGGEGDGDGDEDQPTTTFTVEVRSFGARPAGEPGPGLVVAQYAGFELLTEEARPLDVYVRSPSGTWMRIDHDRVVDASGGTVELGLRAVSGHAAQNGALPLLYFFPVAPGLLSGCGLSPGHPVPRPSNVTVPTGADGDAVPTPPSAMYAAVKVLPSRRAQADEFDELLASAPHVGEVTQWVFDNVYAPYHLTYPVMDFIGSPQSFQQWRGRVIEVTDPAHFDTAAYMPPTRTLTRLQRDILVRYDDYLNTVADPAGPLRARLRAGSGDARH